MTHQTYKWLSIVLVSVSLALFTACASARKNTKTAALAQERASLDPVEQRRFDYFFLEALKMKAAARHDEAFQLLTHSLEVNPQAPEALYEVAQYYLYLEQTDVAVKALEDAVRFAPDNYWYHQALASVYRQLGKNDQAIACWEAITQKFPTREEPVLSLFALYAAEKNYDQQIAVLDRLERIQGKSEELSMEKFRLYLLQEDSKSAFREIDMLVQEYPLDMRYRVVRGDLYLQNDRIDDAKAAYDEVLEADPNNPMAQISMATYYDTVHDDEAYYNQIDTILLNKDVPSSLKTNLLRQLIVGDGGKMKKDSTEIITMFDRIIALDTEDVEIPMLYVQYLIMKDMETESIPVLEHILQLDPPNTAARVTLLGIAIRSENMEWVAHICEAGTEASPEVMEFYFYLGYAYFMLDRFERALETYQRALKLVTPQTDKTVVSDLYSMIGDIQHSLQRAEEAYEAYDKALEYNPSNIGALNNYAYYLSLEQRNLDKAEEMSYKTVKAEPNNSTYLDTYAWILFEKGDYVQARLFIDDALKNNNDSSGVIVEHAGDIYYMNGDADRAVELWERARSLGVESKTLIEKIKKRKYIAEPKR